MTNIVQPELVAMWKGGGGHERMTLAATGILTASSVNPHSATSIVTVSECAGFAPVVRRSPRLVVLHFKAPCSSPP